MDNVGSFWIFVRECLLTIVFVALCVPKTRGKLKHLSNEAYQNGYVMFESFMFWSLNQSLDSTIYFEELAT